jgi:hypothetical protein
MANAYRRRCKYLDWRSSNRWTPLQNIPSINAPTSDDLLHLFENRMGRRVRNVYEKWGLL